MFAFQVVYAYSTPFTAGVNTLYITFVIERLRGTGGTAALGANDKGVPLVG